jgi:antitoxin MazE
MHSRVQKWGNSLAVRIPKAFALEVGLAPDTEVNVSVRDGNLVVAPARRTSYSLKDLVGQVTPSNRHDEASFGPPVGREAW